MMSTKNPFLSRLCGGLLLLLVLLVGGAARSQTGTAFIDPQSWYTDAFGLGVLPLNSNSEVQVETDGTPGVTAGDHIHPYPAAVNAGLSSTRNHRLSPSREWLLIFGSPADFSPGTRIYLYRIPATDGAPLEPIIEGTTVPGISSMGFYDQGAAVSQHIFFVAQTPTIAEQRLMWVDMDEGVTGVTVGLNPNINEVKLAPNGIAAFVQTDGTFAGQGTYHLIELCVDDLGTNINPTGSPWSDLPAPTATAYLLESGGDFEAQVWHGSTSFAPVPLDNCSGAVIPDVGACCLDGNCYDNVTLDFCETQLGGTWQGSGTQCTDISCPPPPAPQLSMTLTGPFTATAGSPLSYTVSFANAGNAAATGVMGYVSVPFGGTFVEASDGGSYSSGTRQIAWSMGTVAAGASGTRTFTVKASCGTSSLAFTNNYLTASNQGSVFGLAYTTWVSDPSSSGAGLTVQKVVPGGEPLRDGDTLEYRFTLDNSEPEERLLRFDCSMGSPLVIDAIVDAAGGTVTDNTSRFWWEGLVPGSSSVTVVVRAVLPACRYTEATTAYLNDNSSILLRNACYATLAEVVPLATLIADKDVHMHVDVSGGTSARTIGSGTAWGLREGRTYVRPGDAVDVRWSFVNTGTTTHAITAGTLSATDWETESDPPFLGTPPAGMAWDAAQQQVTWSGNLAPGDSLSVELRLVYPDFQDCGLSLLGTLATADCGYLSQASATVAGVGEPAAEPYLVYLESYGRLHRQPTSFGQDPEAWLCPHVVEIFSSLTANSDGSYWLAGLPTIRFDPVNLDVAFLGGLSGLVVDHISAVAEDVAGQTAYLAGYQYVDTTPRLRLYALDLVAESVSPLWFESADSTALGTIYDMDLDGQGRLVFTTGRSGLYRLDPAAPTHLEDLADNATVTRYGGFDWSPEGDLLVADSSGLQAGQVVNLAAVDTTDGSHSVLVDMGTLLPDDWAGINHVAWQDSSHCYVAKYYRYVARLDLSGATPTFSIVPGAQLMNLAGMAFDPGSGTTSAVQPEEMEDELPARFVLQGAVPNPFNPRTRLQFELPAEEQVTLVIYDLQGRRVKTLLNERLGAGPHQVTWQGDDENGRSVASGLYFARLQGRTASKSVKLMLTR